MQKCVLHRAVDMQSIGPWPLHKFKAFHKFKSVHNIKPSLPQLILFLENDGESVILNKL